ncbi:SdpI family protein [Adhaeribacter soli]|uniref:DUF1648 domain-containing protein n=1 Tax=Adhaeribacter soli TaxID=2607655 RepID=A0A5N1IVJ4_9BACT|nr:SdpI family protein [Adhaeribacter soli]KAA9331959.1 DUF1648 domain-containing protein [Adhaeribacter soli]
MKNHSKTEFLIFLLLIVPFVYLAFTWNDYPDRVPIHFNHKGEADNYGPKSFGLLMLPVINIFLYLLLKYLPKIDPRKENYALFEGRYKAIRLLIHLFMVFIFVLLTVSMLKGASSLLFPKLVVAGVAVVFMILGNYFSAVRPNYFVGIRTPWTLSNDEVWKKTHRFAGKLWVGASLILLMLVLASEKAHPAIVVIYIGILVIVPVVYSYLLYRKFSRQNGTH